MGYGVFLYDKHVTDRPLCLLSFLIRSRPHSGRSNVHFQHNAAALSGTVCVPMRFDGLTERENFGDDRAIQALTHQVAEVVKVVCSFFCGACDDLARYAPRLQFCADDLR